MDPKRQRGQRSTDPVIVPLRKELDKRETASTDHPSIQSKVRPTTVRPVLLRRKSYIVLRARILAPFKAHTKVAAFDRHNKRGGAAFGRATSFVVSFVLALNRVNVVAVTTILVLHVGVIGHHVPCHYDFMPPVISDLL